MRNRTFHSSLFENWVNKFQWRCLIGSDLYRMGILVIITMTISKSFQIIFHHKLDSISEICFWSVLHPFNVLIYLYLVAMFFLFFLVYLYFIMNFSNELDFHQHFVYKIKNIRNKRNLY